MTFRASDMVKMISSTGILMLEAAQFGILPATPSFSFPVSSMCRGTADKRKYSGVRSHRNRVSALKGGVLGKDTQLGLWRQSGRGGWARPEEGQATLPQPFPTGAPYAWHWGPHQNSLCSEDSAES